MINNFAAKSAQPQESVLPPPVKLMFNLSIFPESEGMKDIKKQKGHNSYLKLSSDAVFDTWKAQLLVKIDEKMKPDRILYEDYDVSFMIPRVSPLPLNVTEEDDYLLLCECTQKAKDLQATVYIQEKAWAVKVNALFDVD